MNVFALFVCSAVVGASSNEFIKDSFIRDNVTPKDFPTLTQRAKAGRTHLASSGSGFFITSNGYLLTNHHVIENAAEVVVVTGNTAYRADVVSKSKDKDIALLKINLFPKAINGVYHMTTNGIPKIPFLSFMTYSEVGMEIYAVGFPRAGVLGWEPKVTRGIIGSLSGSGETSDMMQVDLSIDHGNSGGPIVDEYGFVVGMATFGYSLRANHNFAVKAKTMEAFLRSADISPRKGVAKRRPSARKMLKNVKKSLAIILNYGEGACTQIKETKVDENDSQKRERATQIKKAIIDARLCKLRKEWDDLKKITDRLLETVGEVEDVKEMNDLARDQLGLHLIVRAVADGQDVEAKIIPICGFRDEHLKCGKPLALKGEARRNFPVEATLKYEDAEWEWKGKLSLTYDWQGTREERVELKHVGKK